MQLNSYSYLLFLAFAVAVFWMLPTKFRLWFLIAVSILFYALQGVVFVLVPFSLAIGVFAYVWSILRRTDSTPGSFRIGISYVLLIFTFFRYGPQLLSVASKVLGLFGHEPVRAAFLTMVPLGISFYSFDAISCLIDAKQNRIKHIEFLHVFLYLIFWPSVSSGPILRLRELVPQLSFDRKLDLALLVSGLDRLILGLVQKNLIANSLSSWVNEGFIPQSAQMNSTIDNWFLAIAFGMQVYFDFAGYTNMALGAAKLIGIQLPENFRFPYHARNPSDFWSRWHMSLSRFIRDYLFFPVNAEFKAAPLPLYASLIGIMALVGLWHGFGWGFLIWGILQGTYLVAYRIWEDLGGKYWPQWEHMKPVGLTWRFLTLIAVFAAWIPFRATSLGQIGAMFYSMFFHFRFGISYQLNFYLVTMLCVGFCAVEPYLAKLIDGFAEWCTRRAGRMAFNVLIARPLVYALGLVLFFAFDEHNVQFIYFQF